MMSPPSFDPALKAMEPTPGYDKAGSDTIVPANKMYFQDFDAMVMALDEDLSLSVHLMANVANRLCPAQGFARQHHLACTTPASPVLTSSQQG